MGLIVRGRLEVCSEESGVRPRHRSSLITSRERKLWLPWLTGLMVMTRRHSQHYTVMEPEPGKEKTIRADVLLQTVGLSSNQPFKCIARLPSLFLQM